jgi:hypothetical protein
LALGARLLATVGRIDRRMEHHKERKITNMGDYNYKNNYTKKPKLESYTLKC